MTADSTPVPKVLVVEDEMRLAYEPSGFVYSLDVPLGSIVAGP